LYRNVSQVQCAQLNRGEACWLAGMAETNLVRGRWWVPANQGGAPIRAFADPLPRTSKRMKTGQSSPSVRRSGAGNQELELQIPKAAGMHAGAEAQHKHGLEWIIPDLRDVTPRRREPEPACAVLDQFYSCDLMLCHRNCIKEHACARRPRRTSERIVDSRTSIIAFIRAFSIRRRMALFDVWIRKSGAEIKDGRF